ncbi:alpha/beta hydrolase [Actinophytocola gossypii]|uniref:Alpha/beta hydrolase n=1 Tax=Actinophytocola gossypii TaxID=2812003 RepID=A0ABT2JD56_9PSEU|nr:alpha/beta hydrolase [Actinophytocola gossypii]MCT2585370.1 alpha/beta hydrolase [Actinophytocola gossypii]
MNAVSGALRKTRAVLLRVLVVVVVLAVVVLALAYLFQRRLVYLPDDGPVPAAGSVLDGARDVELRTADGLTLGAWYVPARGTGTGVTVLVAAGNAGNRAARAPLAAALRERGMSVLLFDYRGYGGNPGDPTEDGLALDVRAARRYLVERGAERIVYFGESLGAAVVAELATEHPPCGLLLRSPFTELADVAAELYPFLPVRLLLKDRFRVAEHVRRVRVPTTVVYGSADEIVPVMLSRTVAEAAAGPVTTVEVPGAGHNDPELLDGPRLVGATVRLASQAGGQATC